VLHSIDPAPKFDVEQFTRQFEGHFVFHRAKSLDALPELGQCDVVLIDGDHNWYTVYHELVLLETHAAETGQPFPFILLHDVGWPYGRRDLYYDPDSIPAEYRQPFRRKGIRPHSTALVDVGGLNANLCNAIQEGTPCNGVLTAVEDFLKQTQQDLELLTIPGFCGLGMLVPKNSLVSNDKLAQCVAQWRMPESVTRYVESLESARVQTILRLIDQSLAQRRQQSGLEERVRHLESTVQRLTAQLHASQAQGK